MLPAIPTDKYSVEVAVQHIVDDLVEGRVHPFEALRLRKVLQLFLEGIKPTVDELALAEAEKYGKEGTMYKGVRISFGEFGIRYDYEGTKDPIWKSLKELLKAREDWLRTLKKPEEVVDEDSGEVIMVYPAMRKSTTAPTAEFK